MFDSAWVGAVDVPTRTHGGLRSKLSGDEDGFKTAAVRFRELEMPFWLAVTKLEHAERLTERGADAEAEPLLVKVSEIFERLGAKPWR